MGKNKLDKVIKDKLYDLNTSIDTGELWNGIQNKMGSESSKPVGTFSFRKYFGFGMFGLLLIGGSFILFNQMEVHSPTSPEFTNISSDQLDNASANKSLSSKTNDLSNKNNKNYNQIPAVDDSDQRENKLDNQRKLTNKSNNQITTGQSAYDNNLPSFEKNKNKNKTIQNRTSNNINNNFLEKTSDSQKIIYGSETESTNELIQKSIEENNTKNLNAENISNATTKQKNQYPLLLNLNGIANNINKGLKTTNKTVDICAYKNRVDCYDAWTKDNKFSFVPYVGLDFVTNNRIKTDEFADYLQTRQNTMRFLEVLKSGLLVKYNVTPNLYVKLGAEYDQIREKFESITVDTDTQIITGTIAYEVSMQGDTTAVSGPVEQTVITTTQWRKYNKYHSFNIPVIIGYQTPIAKRWAFFSEAGIFYNVRFTYAGTLLDSNQQVVTGENYFLKNNGISLYGGLGLSYNFNQKWSVFAVGSYKYNLEPINNADFNPIKQNLGLAGLAIGFEYRL